MSDNRVMDEGRAHARQITIELDPSHPEEAEALAMMSTFDARLTAAEKRIDHVLARLA